MDCIVHGVAKSLTQLSDFHFHFPFPCDARCTPSGVPVLLRQLSFGLLCWLFSLLLVSQFKVSKGLYSFLFPPPEISSTSQVSNHSPIMQMTP